MESATAGMSLPPGFKNCPVLRSLLCSGALNKRVIESFALVLGSWVPQCRSASEEHAAIIYYGNRGWFIKVPIDCVGEFDWRDAAS